MATRQSKLLPLTTRIVVCVVALATAGGIFRLLVATRPRPPVVENAASLRRVEVMQAVAVPVRRQWSGFGTAAAIDSADVPAEVLGVVAEVPPAIVAGAGVRAGDVLVRLDDEDYRQNLEIVERQIAEADAGLAQLEVEAESWRERFEIASEETALARAELDRAEEALRRDVAKQREVDQVRRIWNSLLRVQTQLREELDKVGPRRSQLEARRAALAAQKRIAEKDLRRCRIASPLDGVLQAVDVEAGEAVAPGQRVARVVSLARIEVTLRLAASARPTIAVGDAVTLEARGATAGRWNAAVRRIAPEDDQATRTMTVFVELEQDPDGRDLLVPGRFVEGTVTSGRAELRSVVPRRSLLDDRILLVADDQVWSRPARVDFTVRGEWPELGVRAEQWAVLAEPLPPSSLVVVNATRSLGEGLPVQPVLVEGDVASRSGG